jgi:ribosomal protein S18 acetylase RimI-like enzyme
MIEVKALNENRWQDYRNLRLESLKKDTLAFGSSWEEETNLPEETWKRRMRNTLFALDEDKLVGTIVWVQDTMLKAKHIANIYGVYVTEEYRGRGVGRLLMDAALARIKKNGGVIKVKLAVNPTQKAAVKLYQSYGFKIAGKAKKELYIDGRYYDELIMEKML